MSFLGAISPVDIQAALIGLTTFLITKWLLSTAREPETRKRLPRGPKPYPFFGNALTFWKNDCVHLELDLWAQEYGDVYTIRLGQYDVIVVSSERAVRELLVTRGDQTNYRPIMFIHRLMDATKGILNNMGAPWREQRRIAITALRDFGVGKMTIEQRILEESQRIICRLDECDGQPIDLHTSFILASSNIICSIIFGERYEENDKEFLYLMKELQFIFAQGGIKNISLYFPELIFLLPVTFPYILSAIRRYVTLQSFVMNKVNEHRESFDSENLRDFLDLYLQTEAENGRSSENETQMFQTILDLFLAGSETVSTTLRWCLLYLVRHADVQDKLRTEIFQITGQNRSPSYSDHSKMPYTQAVIEETLRLGNTTPLTLIHTANQDLEFRNYLLPKGTMIIGNLFTVHLDPENFPDPLEFRPARWLDSAGNFTKHHSFMGFGLGPRECPGKLLAYQEIFLLLTALIQQFRFTASEPESLPSTQGRLGITHSPQDYCVRAQAV